MIKFIPYEPEHLERLDPREGFEASSSVLMTEQGPKLINQVISHGNALTIVGLNDEILAIVLWFTPAPGMIDIGMFASKAIYRQPCSYLRFARRKFKEFLASLDTGIIRRIQTMSYCDAKHDQWMKWLGFECEGTLKKYAHNGADMRVWAITGA